MLTSISIIFLTITIFAILYSLHMQRKILKIHSIRIDLMRVELGLPTLKSREEIFAEAEKLSK